MSVQLIGAIIVLVIVGLCALYAALGIIAYWGEHVIAHYFSCRVTHDEMVSKVADLAQRAGHNGNRAATKS